MSIQPTQPPGSPALLEQYKAYLQDLGNIGTRYTTSNSFYLSIISAFLGILALTKPSDSLTDLQTILRFAVPFFACLLCLTWAKTLVFYNELFRVKFDVLGELEQRGGLVPVYTREEDLLHSRRVGRILKNEHLIPLVLAVPFLFILADTVWKLSKR